MAVTVTVTVTVAVLVLSTTNLSDVMVYIIALDKESNDALCVVIILLVWQRKRKTLHRAHSSRSRPILASCTKINH